MRILKLLVGAALAMGLVAAGFAHADVENAGTTTANFLTVGAGPRVLSMGGATLGLGDDITAGIWNPAALGWASRTEFAISHAGLANESSQEWAAFGGRLGQSDTRWAVTGLYQGEGTFEGRDASNNPTGTFSASSMAFGAHLAHQVGGRLTIGFGAKSVLEKLGDVSGFGFTFDGGAMYRTEMWGVGVAGTNLGGQMRYDGVVYGFPSVFGVGVAVTPPGTGLRLALDANFPKAYYTDVRTGVEWMWRDMVAVRGGYRYELGASDDDLTGPSFGLGAGSSGFWFDYGYLLSNGGESQHRIGLRLLPGSMGMNGTPFGFDESTTEKPKPARASAKPPQPKPESPKASKTPKSTEPTAKAVASKPAPVKSAPAQSVPVAAVKPEKAAQVASEKSEPAKPVQKIQVSSPSPAPIAALTPAPAPVKSEPAPAKAKVETKVAPVKAKVETKVAPAPAKSEPPAPAPTKAEPVVETPKPQVEAPKAKVEESKPKVEESKPRVEESKPKAEESKPKAEESKPKSEETPMARPEKIKVQSGETLDVIAKRWKTSKAAIMMENNLVSEKVKPGKVLKLPRN